MTEATIKPPLAQVVIAWTVSAVVFDGKPYAADLGKRAGTKEVREGRACMWLREATIADIEKAKAYCAKQPPAEGETEKIVFVYQLTEEDPLGRARKDVLQCEQDIGRTKRDGQQSPVAVHRLH